MSASRSSLVAWSGFAMGPFAWGASTQANYTWVTLSCDAGVSSTTLLTLVFALISLTGACLSWRALRSLQSAPAEAPYKPRTERFVAGLGIGMGFLFALAILFQFAATLIFTGFER